MLTPNGSAWTTDDTSRTANAAPARTTSTTTTMPSYTTPRNVSGPLAVDKAPMSPDENSSWNRPNHYSTPNSKTSQYIDKITQENDRLRRELRAEKLAREDEAKRVSAAQTKAEDSRAEYQHLQVPCSKAASRSRTTSAPGSRTTSAPTIGEWVGTGEVSPASEPRKRSGCWATHDQRPNDNSHKHTR